MKFHTVESIGFVGDRMMVDVDGRRVNVDLARVSPLLAAASPEERMRYEVSPSGYGIHWPGLDEDLSIDALLGIRHGPKTKLAEYVAEDGPASD